MALKFVIASELPEQPAAHTLYFVKIGNTVKTWITDENGVPFLQSSGSDGNEIEPLLFAGLEDG